MRKIWALFAVFAFGLYFGGSALATTGLTLDMPHIPAGVTITIDAELDDWKWAADAGYGYTEADFFVVNGAEVPAEDLSFVVYLAWSDPENMIYVAVSVTDDVFNYDPEEPGFENDGLGLYVDADQSGGMYAYDEAINYWAAEGQEIILQVGAPPGSKLEMGGQFPPFFIWVGETEEQRFVIQAVTEEPNAYWATKVEDPNWAAEVKMKIWDTLGPDKMSTDDWVEHELTEGEIIGFGVHVNDADAVDAATGVAKRETGMASYSGGEYWRNADDFSEALLLSAPAVAVSPTTWGSIKALYR